MYYLSLTFAVNRYSNKIQMMQWMDHKTVRGLEALGVKSEQYGSLLIPVTMAKLPTNIRLQIAGLTKKDVWHMDELLKVIKEEIEAREQSEST